MPQILPGLDTLLGPSLNKFSETLMDVFQPNKKFQVNLRNMLTEKPELMLAFSDLEKAAPGTMAAMGFGDKLSGMISAMPESIDAELKRTGRDKILATRQKELSNKDKEATIEAGVLDKAAILMGGPEGEDVMRKKLGLKSRAEVYEGDIDTKTKKLNLDEKTADLEVTKIQREMTKKALANAVAIGDNLEDIDMNAIAKSIVNGKTVDTNLLLGLLGRDDTRAVMGQLLQSHSNIKAAENAQVLASIRSSADGVTGTTRFRSAYDRYKTTGAGSVSTWEKFLDPTGKERTEVLELAEGAREKSLSERTVAERDAIAVVDAEINQQASVGQDRARKVSRDIRLGIADLYKAVGAAKDPKGRESVTNFHLSEINRSLQENGLEYIAKYGELPGDTWYGRAKTGLYFENASGDVLDETEMTTQLNSTAQAAQGDKATMTEAIFHISSMPAADQAKGIELMKGTPYYDGLVEHFKKGGESATKPTSPTAKRAPRDSAGNPSMYAPTPTLSDEETQKIIQGVRAGNIKRLDSYIKNLERLLSSEGVSAKVKAIHQKKLNAAIAERKKEQDKK